MNAHVPRLAFSTTQQGDGNLVNMLWTVSRKHLKMMCHCMGEEWMCKWRLTWEKWDFIKFKILFKGNNLKNQIQLKCIAQLHWLHNQNFKIKK